MPSPPASLRSSPRSWACPRSAPWLCPGPNRPRRERRPRRGRSAVARLHSPSRVLLHASAIGSLLSEPRSDHCPIVGLRVAASPTSFHLSARARRRACSRIGPSIIAGPPGAGYSLLAIGRAGPEVLDDRLRGGWPHTPDTQGPDLERRPERADAAGGLDLDVR